MPSDAEIRARINELITRSSEIQFHEIESVLHDLGAADLPCDGGRLFRLRGRRLVIGWKSDQSKVVLRHSLRDFKYLMLEMDLY